MHAAFVFVPYLLFGISLAGPLTRKQAATYPFSQMIVFGDDLSDNGNGTYAYTGSHLYAHNTWSNGPVTPSYLSTMLGVPLTLDYAMGGTNGGANFGATIDNNFTASNSNPEAPSSKDQIANYTSGTIDADWKSTVGNSLHFLWIGRNDIMPWWVTTSLPHSSNPGIYDDSFGAKFSTLLVEQIQTLLDAGSNYVIVPNLYPKQYSPWAYTYASATTVKQRGIMGDAIKAANNAIQSAITNSTIDQSKVLYVDVYTIMEDAFVQKSNGITYTTKTDSTEDDGTWSDWFCDPQDWDTCFNTDYTDKDVQGFFWINYLDVTTKVHEMVATGIAEAVKGKWGA